MSKRPSAIPTTSSFPKRGFYILQDPVAGLSEKLDAGVLLEMFMSRRGADYLQSDGATANRRIETQYGALGAVAGSDLTEADYVFDVPSTDPAENCAIFQFGSANNSLDLGNSLQATINTAGALFITAFGADYPADIRRLTYIGFRAAYSGRRIRFTVAFTGGSATSPVVYVDGVDISASFSASSGGTLPNWVDASLATGYHLSGYNWPAGYFRPGRPVNRKYAQADVDFVQLTGRLPYADAMGGSTVSRLSGDDSTFASSGNWSLNLGSTISGGKLNIPAGANAGNSLAQLVAGRRCRFTIVVDSLTAGSVRYFNGVSALQFGTGAGTYTVEFTAAADFNGILFYAVGGDAVFDTALFFDVGALSDPIIQPCAVLDDATPNNRASILVGFRPVTTRKDWRIPAWIDMSTTGNKQLLGGAVLESPTKQAIDTIETTCAGAPTFSVGDGTTATKYTASVAHSAARLRETVSANFPADAAKTGIYADVTALHASSTAELIIVRGHRE